MYLSYHHIVLAICLALGTYWCIFVIARLREDIDELRTVKDKGRQAAIIFIWLVTLVIAVLLIRFAVGLVGDVVRAFG